ncbi:MAG: adenylyl-sulfate kinase [Flavobacteriia bacterium]|jgi:bifunctional enzyme CysN/CysC|nr:adenylyl-sulfate kinase [Flavobacteriia bacterium]
MSTQRFNLDNVKHQQNFSVTHEDRARLNGHVGKVIWFTGLSGAGKSTLANSLEIELYRNSFRTYVIDGDNVREGLNRDLEFSEADRIENLRRVTEVSKLMMDAGLIVIAAFISPFKRERERIKKSIGEANFIEVFVSTPLEVCEQRDPKGLYKKARAGKILNMTGISSPYEAPDSPNFTVSTQKPTDQFVRELSVFIINLARRKA